MKRIVRWLLGAFMIFMGVSHFARPDLFLRIMPPVLPAPLLLVYVSGLFELLFGVCLFIRPLRVFAALGLIPLYVAIFPANVYMAFEGVQIDPANPMPEWVAWARLPFQLVFIGLAYWLSRPDPEDMGNFVPLEKPSAFRRMAAAMWHRPNDATIYGNAEMDMRRALAYLEKRNAASEVKLTMTHFVARALALSIARFPEINARVRFWGKLERRKTVDVFVQVAAEGGRDLSGLRISAAEQKPLEAIAAELATAAKQIRSGDDPKFKKSKGLVARLPWWSIRPFLATASALTNELLIDMSGSGMPADPFGSAMVTSLGMFGVDEAYAPLTPIARCMMIVLVPAVRDKVVVEDGQMVVRPILKLCATFDHRIVDGVHAAKLCSVMREIILDPEQHMPNG